MKQPNGHHPLDGARFLSLTENSPGKLETER